MSATLAQAKRADAESKPDTAPDGASTARSDGTGVPAYLGVVQKKCTHCAEEAEREEIAAPETQLKAGGEAGANPTPSVHTTAARGVAQADAPLPGAGRIQAAFGRHDISDVRAQVGGPAADASQQMGARAYTLGRRIGFKSRPDLRLAAHEAAHAVQQRHGVSLKGGVGRPDDKYERQADAVAERVAANRSAEDLLDAHPDPESKPALQAKCACGGSCPKCAAEARADEEGGGAVQLELEVNATRQFESAVETAAAAPSTARDGGGEGGEGDAGGKGGANGAGAGGAEGGAEAEGGKGAAGAGGAGASAPGAGSEGGASGAAPRPPAAPAEGGAAPASHPAPASAPAGAPGAEGGGSGTGGGGAAAPSANAPGGAAPAAPAAAAAPAAGGGGGTTVSRTDSHSAGGGGAVPQCYRGKKEEPAHPPDTQPPNPPPTQVQQQTNEGEDEEVPEPDNCAAATQGAVGGNGAPGAPGAAGSPGVPATASAGAAAPAEAGGTAAAARPAAAGAGQAGAGGSGHAAGGGGGEAAATPAGTPLDGVIGAAEGQRAVAVAAYAESRGKLAAASSGTAALRNGIAFSAQPGETAPAATQRVEASARAGRFFSATADRLDAVIAQASGSIPDQIGVAAESGKAQIAAALASEKFAISGRIEQARGQARSQAARAASAVRAQAAAHMGQVRATTSAAITSLRAAHKTTTAQVDQLETTTLDQINTTYATGRTDLERIGTTIGGECTKKGAEFAATYRTFDTCTTNGYFDGDLSQRRAKAQANAAEEVAKGYHDRLVSAARQRAREATRDGRKADRCVIIQTATQTRSGLDSTLDGLVQAMEHSRDAALAQAGSARDGLLASIHAGLAGTLHQLDQQEHSQRQTADDTAYAQQLLQEQTAHSTAAAVQNAVAAAIGQVQTGLATVQARFNSSAAPELSTLEQALSEVEVRIVGALDGLATSVDGGGSNAEGRLASSAAEGVAALAQVSQGNAEQAGTVEGGFGQSMNGIAGRDNFASQRRSFNQQITQATSAGTGAFSQALSGMQKGCTATLTQAAKTLAKAHTDLEANLRQQRQGLEGDMTSKADEAASHEAPAWKRLLAIVLIIVVIIIVVAVIVASGGAALGPLAAAMAALGPILTGAIVGAITSTLIYAATSLWNNEDITLAGLGKAALIGAITGAVGGGIGAWAGSAIGASLSTASAAVQVAGQLAAAMAVNIGLDVATQFVLGGFSFDHFSWGQIGVTVLVTLVTFGIGHATAARPQVEAPPGAAAGEEPRIGFGRTPGPRPPGAPPVEEPRIGFGRTPGPKPPGTPPVEEPRIGFGRTPGPKPPGTPPVEEPRIGFGRTPGPKPPGTPPVEEPRIGFGRTPGPKPPGTPPVEEPRIGFGRTPGPKPPGTPPVEEPRIGFGRTPGPKPPTPSGGPSAQAPEPLGPASPTVGTPPRAGGSAPRAVAEGTAPRAVAEGTTPGAVAGESPTAMPREPVVGGQNKPATGATTPVEEPTTPRVGPTEEARPTNTPPAEERVPTGPASETAPPPKPIEGAQPPTRPGEETPPSAKPVEEAPPSAGPAEGNAGTPNAQAGDVDARLGQARSLTDSELDARIRETPKTTDPADDSNVLRYERYRRGGGTKNYDEWFGTSRGGRAGSVAHQQDVATNNGPPNNLEPRAVGNRVPDGVSQPGQSVVIRGQTIKPVGNGRVIVESDHVVYEGTIPNSEARAQMRAIRAADPDATLVVTDLGNPSAPPLVYPPGTQPPPPGNLPPNQAPIVPYP